MSTQTGTKPRKRRAPKPEGQWKVDGTKPLNDDERIKAEEPAFAVK